MKKIISMVIRVGIVLVMVGVAVWGVWRQSSQVADPSGKPVVKIGFLSDLTGNNAQVDTIIKKAAEKALHDLQTRSLKNQYKIIFEDHASDIKKVPHIMRRLIHWNHIDAVVAGMASVGLIVSPLATQNKIIHINITSFDTKVADGQYNFLHRTMPEKEIKKFIEQCKKGNIKKVALITAASQGMVMFSADLKKALDKEGIAYDEISIVGSTTDVSLLVEKLKRKNYDLYCLLLYQPSLEAFLRNLYMKKVNKPVTTFEMFAHVREMNLIEGNWYIDSSALTPEARSQFEAAGINANFELVGNAYDAIMLIVEAFEKADTKEEAAEALRNIKEYNGVVGRLTQDKNGIFHSPAVVKKVVDGKGIIVGE